MDPTQLPLRDLHLPDPVGWWPPAPGWWLLAALVVVALAWFLRRWLDHRARARARRHALRQLDRYAEEYARHGNAVTLGTDVSELLRRTMLAYAPRSEVAGLTGDAWLEWLDRGLERPVFRQGDGRPLVEWPYRDPTIEVESSRVSAFLDAVRLRLNTPVGEAG